MGLDARLLYFVSVCASLAGPESHTCIAQVGVMFHRAGGAHPKPATPKQEGDVVANAQGSRARWAWRSLTARFAAIRGSSIDLCAYYACDEEILLWGKAGRQLLLASPAVLHIDPVARYPIDEVLLCRGYALTH